MLLLRHLAGVLAVAVVWPTQAGTVIHVDDDNCPGPGTGTEADPFCFIQDAIDAAVDTDEILVAPGFYFETINLQGKAVDLHSAGGELVTFIDGTGFFTSVVTCDNGEGPATVVNGFTIMNGTAFLGAGMLISASSPTVMNCTFQMNSADAGGGGMFIQQSAAAVANCTFTSNVSGLFGGALYSFASTTQIMSCAFNDNSAIQFGGAIYGNLASSLSVIDCTFANNRTTDSNTAQGGAIYSASSPTVISNSDFTGNSAGHDGGGVQISNVSVAGMAIVSGCLFVQNSAPEDGGGLRFDNCQGPVVSNCQFQQNTVANGDGGGLRLTTSPNALVTDCTFTDNQAFNEGGGMDVVQSPGGTIVGCVFDSNRVWDDDGAGLQVDRSDDFAITDCTFNMNTSGDDGGGLFLDESDDVAITGCTFNMNTSGYDGGGLYVEQSSNVTITSCMFTANTAVEHGGGMVVDTCPDAMIMSCTFTANRSFFDEGGGMRLAHSTGGSVVGCDFVSNRAGTDGGGLQIHELINATITSCTFTDNDAGNAGGGLILDDGDCADGDLTITVNITVNSCTFTENVAGSTPEIGAGGGGIDICGNPNVTVTGCTFDSNTSTTTGGGIDREAESGRLFLDGCSFTGNTAVIAGAGIFSRTDVTGGSAGVTGTDEFVSLGELSPGEVRPSNCCFDNGTPSCDDPGCVSIVCTLNLSCCIVVWDSICAGQAMDLCGTLCRSVGNFPIGVPFTQVLELAEGPSLSAGTLVMDLAGTTPGTEHDHIPFTPRATLRGGLRATLVGYAPALGDRFEIITAPSIEGHFDVVFFPGLPDGLFMRLETAPGLLAGGGSVTIIVDSLGSLLGFDDPESVGIDGLASGVAVGDFDGQNGIDVAIALPDAVSGSVLVLLNAGLDASGNWLGFLGPPIQPPVGGLLSGITVGELDGDQDLDIAVSDFGGNVFVLLNDIAASGTFIVQPAIAVGTLPSAIAAGDFGEDPGPAGDTDLVVTNAGDDTLVVLFNDGNANFQLGPLVLTGANPLAVIPCDLDNDKDLDAIVANSESNTVSVVINLGDGSFAPAMSLGVGDTPVQLAAADFDGNGLEDIVTVNRGAGSVSVILNESTANNPQFTSAVNLPVGSFPRSITTLDLESDGDVDIVLVAINAQNEAVVQVIRNDLNQGEQLIFAEASELATGQDPVLLISGDLDRDGTEDLITINDAPPPPESAGAGGPFVGSANVRLNSLCAVDIDNDGFVALPDFETLLMSWGPCPPKGEPCPADFDRDMNVGMRDILFLLGHWGPCP